MIKLVATIIDKQCNLKGFVCRGKQKEFGVAGTEEIFRALTIEALAKVGFKNNQVEVRSNGVVYELGYFRIHDLPMKMLNDSGISDVNNSIEILATVKLNNAVGGYDVKLLDSKMRLDTNSVIRVSRYFKPVNFQVRVKQDGSYFIAGSNGAKMSDFPVIDLDKPQNIGKNHVAGRKPSKGVVNKDGVGVKETQMQKLGSQVGLMDLYTAVQSNGGYLVLLPDNTYTKTLSSNTEYSKAFVSYGIGEMAKLSGNGFTLNKTELNASATFRKPGSVKTSGGISVDCYTISTKKLINNGKNHIKHIGIAVTNANAMKSICNLIGDPARCKLIEDERTIELLRETAGVESLQMFDCDISDIPVVLPRNYDNYIFDTDTLYEKVVNLTGAELANKYIRTGTGLCNELKKALGSAEAAKISGRTLYWKYKDFPAELVKEISEMGIDVFSGAYTKMEKSESKGTSNSSVSGDAPVIVNIKYLLKGFDVDKWSYSKIKAEYESNGNCQLPGRNLVESVINFNGTDAEKYAMALKVAEQVERYVEALRKEIWLHKYCMYKKYDGYVHREDKELWLPAATKKKTASVYECEKHNGFLVEISGTDI